jgi:hypothetical protein
MNGRMYDPVIGRMLSPDPYVVNPFFSQDFNRYSYVRNNPLSYTDPTGYRVGEYNGYTPDGKQIRYYSGGGGGFYKPSMHFYMGMTAEAGGLGIGGWDLEVVGDDGIAAGGYAYTGRGFAGGVAYAGGGLGRGSRNNNSRNNNNNNQSVHISNSLGNTGAMLFQNRDDAFEYMWRSSHDINGNWKREVSAWVLTDGRVVVLPYGKNTETKSFNDRLSLKMEGRVITHVYFEGKPYKIDYHVHTHPIYSPTPSDEDKDFQDIHRIPTLILHGRITNFTSPTSFIYIFRTFPFTP